MQASAKKKKVSCLFLCLVPTMPPTLIDFHSDILRIILSRLSPSSKTAPVVLRFVCRRFRDLIPFSSIKTESLFFCAYAALEGHVNLLEWARSLQAPWDMNTCAQAAIGGHVDVLQWLRENGCPWNEQACYIAARYGHLEVFQWAIANDCPYDKTYLMNQANVKKWVAEGKIVFKKMPPGKAAGRKQKKASHNTINK